MGLKLIWSQKVPKILLQNLIALLMYYSGPVLLCEEPRGTEVIFDQIWEHVKNDVFGKSHNIVSQSKIERGCQFFAGDNVLSLCFTFRAQIFISVCRPAQMTKN